MGDISKRVATYSSPPKKVSECFRDGNASNHLSAAFNGIFLHMYRKVPESFWKAASTGANMVCAASTSSLLMQIHVAPVTLAVLPTLYRIFLPDLTKKFGDEMR
jgi:hypothetical protein